VTGSDGVGRYAALTAVRDGDGFVLGSRYSGEFVAVPEIGGQVVRWLQVGVTVAECARRATEIAGESVDVAGFLDGLAQAGLLPADGGAPCAPLDVAAWKRNLGRVLFGTVGLTVQGLLAAAAVGATIAAPRVRPVYTDAIVTTVPLASVLLIAIIGTALGLAHEFAHVLAAWAAGVTSRVSIGRRGVALVYQTDLTRLWSVPRRARVVPLLAGMVFDAATIGLLDLLELTVLRDAPPIVLQLTRAVVFLNIGAIVFQFLIFLRTDVYALFVVATGCKNLWATKGAVARRAIRRATPDDMTLLNTVGQREIVWAKVFLWLYMPGMLWSAWYFLVYGIPALVKILATSLTAATTQGLTSPAGGAGVLAFALTAASTAYLLWGLVRTIFRLGRQILVQNVLSQAH
jgi:hypothetical protein